MKQTKEIRIYHIFIALFIGLNVLNTYFLTLSVLNRYIAPLSHTFIGELTALIGNLSVMMLYVFLTSIFFKSIRKRMIFLTVFTFVLNFFIFALGIFNLYYGTAFAVDMLNLFKNPTGGFAGQTAMEAFREIIVYYRIVVFIPFFVLLIWLCLNAKRIKNIKIRFSAKRSLIHVLSVLLIITGTAITFTKQLMNDIPIQSVASSYAVQNYGVYPYYLKEFLGIKTTIDANKVLNVASDEAILNLIEDYNKNVSSYTNIINGQTYSNRLTQGQANIDYLDSTIQDGDNLHGIFAHKNLVLIHLESFNYFLLQNEYTNEQMSFLNDLLSESYVFSNFYTNVGMGVSSDAEFSVLTGLNPQGDQTLYWNYNDIPYDLPSIPKYMQEAGYYTEVIHADLETFYNRNNVYPGLFEFNRFYSLEDFVSDGYDIDLGYTYNHNDELTHISPWASDYYLADYTANYGESLTSPFMLYPIYMMGHTPFNFGPYDNSSEIYPHYAPLVSDITLRYINYANYYSETIKRLFISETGDDQTIDDTVYIFYSDHGAGLKNGDLDILHNRELNDLEERQILQQTLAFIYVPSNDEYVDFGEYQIRKGMMKGEQHLVRSQIDLYRTIVELFDLPVGNDMYFGVNGLSTEPTFALDNRILDVVTDDYFYSLRNKQKSYPANNDVDLELHEYIKIYKLLCDYLLSTENELKNINNLLDS